MRNVLCVSSFKLNLLSLAKLTRELNCIMKLYPDFCLLQDLVKRIGKMVDDLYHLKSERRIKQLEIACITSLDNDIRHKRLGHVPHKVLPQMKLTKQSKNVFFVIFVL